MNIINPVKDVHREVLFGPAVVTTAVSAYKSVVGCDKFVVYVAMGATDNTLDVALLQATDSSGTGAKAIAAHSVTAAITQLSGTDDNKQAAIEVNVDALDDGFTHVAASITVAGVTTAFIVLEKYPNKKPVTQPTAFVEQVVVIG